MNMTPSAGPSEWHRRRQLAFAVAALYAVAACTGHQAFRDGQVKLAQGQTESGLAKLREAMDADPSSTEFRRTYFTQRDTALSAQIRAAELALDRGDFAQAKNIFEAVVRADPGNPRGVTGLDRAGVEQRHGRLLETAVAEVRDGKVDAAISKVQQVLSENRNHGRARALLRQLLRQQADATGKELGIYPKLKAAYRVPVTLSFTNASLLQVFEALKHASGLNYMIERDVKPDLRVTLAVVNKPVEDIVRLLLVTNQLERRVLDDDTLLIYPKTPAKLAEYREMVVRSFYLNHAEAAKVAETIRALIKTRDVVVDEKLNMLMVRDSEDVIRLAEKIIVSQDIAEPEVMLELEVLEVSANRLIDMGLKWPSSVSASVVGGGGVAGQLTLDELHKRSAGLVRLGVGDPLLSAQLKSQIGEANLLANPRVRVRNKRSAKILIGERVPVITTTTTANVGNSESISYLDVGLKLEIEPTVTLNDEVAMKIALEVSNITQTITLTSGSQAYRLGTRNTATSLQVHDGETHILAGLIQRNTSHSNTGVPGLNELPVLNRLFGSAEDADNRTEIVLLITPHIVRNLDVPGIGQQEFLSGTEATTGGAPIQLGVPTGQAGAFQQPLRPNPALTIQPGLAVPGNPNLIRPQIPQPQLQQQPSGPGSAATPPAPPPLLAPSLIPSPPRQ